MKRIFLLDDDELILDSFSMILGDLGFEVTTSSKALEGISIACEQDFDLVLTDIRMPDANGAQAVKAILERKPLARIYVMTAYPGDPVVQLALQSGAQGVMKKPFEIAKILSILKD